MKQTQKTDRCLTGTTTRSPIGRVSRYALLSAAALAMMFTTSAEAATLLQYHDGTTSTAAYNEAAGITGSTLTYDLNDSFRTSFGGAGSTPAGPTAGTAAGSNWMLWRKAAIDIVDVPLDAQNAYAGFTMAVGAAADGTIPGDLTFDLAGGGANGNTSGIDVNYQVFAQLNGGGFSGIGTPSGFIELIPQGTADTFSDVLTGVVDLSSLGGLSTGDAVDIRIAIRSEDNAGVNNIGLFMQGIQLEAFTEPIPEPSSSALLGLGGLLLLAARRRRNG